MAKTWDGYPIHPAANRVDVPVRCMLRPSREWFIGTMTLAVHHHRGYTDDEVDLRELNHVRRQLVETARADPKSAEAEALDFLREHHFQHYMELVALWSDAHG